MEKRVFAPCDRVPEKKYEEVKCKTCKGKGGYHCWDCTNCNGHGYTLEEVQNTIGENRDPN